MLHNNNKAMIVLHEIYGVNEFIKSKCQKFFEEGYDVYCPNLLHRSAFSYEQSAEAYHFFVNQVGFDKYTEIVKLTNRLKGQYEDVFMIGFSVGATLAWRSCEHTLYSGVIACYGSRIRDYIDLNLACPTLAIFAKNDSFDVEKTVNQLQGKLSLEVQIYEANHVFFDRYSETYNEQQAKLAEHQIITFLNR